MAMQGEVRVDSWARRGRRLLLGLSVLAAAGFAVLFLAAMLVVHGGPLQAVLLTVLTLIIVATLLAAVVGWVALRLWRRGAWPGVAAAGRPSLAEPGGGRPGCCGPPCTVAVSAPGGPVQRLRRGGHDRRSGGAVAKWSPGVARLRVSPGGCSANHWAMPGKCSWPWGRDAEHLARSGPRFQSWSRRLAPGRTTRCPPRSIPCRPARAQGAIDGNTRPRACGPGPLVCGLSHHLRSNTSGVPPCGLNTADWDHRIRPPSSVPAPPQSASHSPFRSYRSLPPGQSRHRPPAGPGPAPARGSGPDRGPAARPGSGIQPRRTPGGVR
jgi:hypothetical protein